jgi:hypothetical protein
MKQGDRILIIIIAILALILIMELMLTKNYASVVVVRSDGNIVKTVSLNKNMVFEVKSNEGHLFVEIKNRKVRVINSTCKDKLCEKEGWIEKPGESIICLPNRISITIIGKKKDNVDTITY